MPVPVVYRSKSHVSLHVRVGLRSALPPVPGLTSGSECHSPSFDTTPRRAARLALAWISPSCIVMRCGWLREGGGDDEAAGEMRAVFIAGHVTRAEAGHGFGVGLAFDTGVTAARELARQV